MLPKVLEDIIIDFKNQIEHTEKLEKSLKEIRSIIYGITNNKSTIIKPEKMKVVFHYNFRGKLILVVRGEKYYNVLLI